MEFSMSRRPLPPSLVIPVILLLILVPIVCNRSRVPVETAAPGTYQLCFWNVEDLFDDREDDEPNKADREYDRFFAKDPSALRLKLEHLSEVLTQLNGGNGPDILDLAEVESPPAAQLRQDALNSRLRDPALHYTHVLMKNAGGGRHISTAILTRLPVEQDRTRLHGSRLRIL